ncbi:MAG TPA: CHAD domain-containing protein [Bacteroidales bacterium]|nr:CHAD domain-containing protein [Bacteroidales bacterium]HSA43396.1 CHAD domain-containing protein [Bacteroidales bacterium]
MGIADDFTRLGLSYCHHRDILLRSQDEISVHQLRLSVKKMRALFDLMESIAPERFSTSAHLGEIRQVFRYSSALRDLQVQKGIFHDIGKLKQKKYTSLISFLDQLEKQQFTQLRKKLRKTGDQVFTMLSDYIAVTFDSRYDEAEIRQIFKWRATGLLRDAAGIFDTGYEAKALHEIRRKVKQAYFLMKFRAIKNIRTKDMQLGSAALHRLEERLGSWNDTEVSLDYFKTFRKGSGREVKESAIYRDLHRELKERNTHLYLASLFLVSKTLFRK